MQLTFPSNPFDSTAIAPAAAGGTALANVAGVTADAGGFAALLAGVAPTNAGGAPSAPGAQTGPAAGGPTAAPLNGTWPDGMSIASAPATLGQPGVACAGRNGTVSLTSPAQVAPVGIGMTGLQPVEADVAAPANNNPSAPPAPAGKRKALVAEGDIQGVAVAMMQVAATVPAPTPVSTRIEAGAQNDGSEAATPVVAGTTKPGVSFPFAGGAYAAAFAGFVAGRGVPTGGAAQFRLVASRAQPASPTVPVGADSVAITDPKAAAVDAFATTPPVMGEVGKCMSAGVAGELGEVPSASIVTSTAQPASPAFAASLKVAGAAQDTAPSLGKEDSSAAKSRSEPAVAPVDPKAAVIESNLVMAGAKSEAGSPGDLTGTVNQMVKTGAADAASAPEKFAANGVEAPRASKSADKSAIKSTLVSSSKEVGKGEEGLGIGAAETRATMSSGSLLDRPTVTDPTVVHSTTGAADAAARSSALPPEVALPSSAHRAVEAALSASERFASRDQQSVNLQFTVGGNELNVRVELRAGEVHTTFRTDSAELRSALSNEWQSVTGQSNADRSVRLATPVFTTTSGDANSFSDRGANDQRQADTEPRTPSFASVMPRDGRSATVATTATPAVRTVSASSVHLHTLA